MNTTKKMINASVDSGQSEGVLVTCPKCGQKLLSVVESSEYVRLRCKCRRCGTYIRVDIL